MRHIDVNMYPPIMLSPFPHNQNNFGPLIDSISVIQKASNNMAKIK